MKTPTWGQIEKFCKADGWQPVRSTNHLFYEKPLPDGTVLRTHVSHARNKGMSEDTFRLILRHQLKVSAAAFWDALKTGRPAIRPSPPPPAPRPALPAPLAWQLRRQAGMSEEAVARVTKEEAVRILNKLRARPR